MSDANSYYQSLIQQGYDVNKATVYTQEHFPGFEGPGLTPQPAVAAPVATPAPAAANASDPMMMMMMMNQQNQQSQQSQQAAMMQQQALLAQSQVGQNQPQQIIHVGNTMGKPSSTGYLLWLCCLFGICGVHRFHYGRIGSGIIYLFTFGLFGFGQLYDLLIMPELARTAPK